jgi:hypothetical protein
MEILANDLVTDTRSQMDGICMYGSMLLCKEHLVSTFNRCFTWFQHMHLFKIKTCILNMKLAVYQKGIYCAGIRIFRNLPPLIKNLSDNTRQFKSALKCFLYTNSFYLFDEYFNMNEWKYVVYYPNCSFWTNILLC